MEQAVAHPLERAVKVRWGVLPTLTLTLYSTETTIHIHYSTTQFIRFVILPTDDPTDGPSIQGVFGKLQFNAVLLFGNCCLLLPPGETRSSSNPLRYADNLSA